MDPGAPPPAKGGTEMPQLPYKAAPGMIMGLFLLSDMADINDAVMVREFEASLKHYEDLPDTDNLDYFSAIRELMSDCLEVDELVCFLSAIKVLSEVPVFVSVISALS